jgi:hypothetical protein
MWDEILPPIAEYQWWENLALVAAWLAEFGGRTLVEPPRIDWQAPAAFALPPEDGAESIAAEDVTSTTDATGTTDASAGTETDDASKSTLPDEFATARDIRVVPGPAGYSPIVEEPAQKGNQGQKPAPPVPGQREGSAHDRDPSAAAPA